MDMSLAAVDTFEPSWVRVVYPASVVVSVLSAILLAVFVTLRFRRQTLRHPELLEVHIWFLSVVVASAIASLGYHFGVREPQVRSYERATACHLCPMREAANREACSEATFAAVGVSFTLASWRAGVALKPRGTPPNSRLHPTRTAALLHRGAILQRVAVRAGEPQIR